MTSRTAKVATVFLSSFVQGLVSVAYPASAAVLRARGLSDAQYGSLFVPQVVLAAVGAAGAGALLDRLGAKRSLSLGFVFMGLSQAALAAVGLAPPAAAYALALLGTSMLGLGAGVSAGALNAYPQVLFPSRSESAVVALHTVVGLGLAGTPLLAGMALALDAWLILPLFILALCTALVVAVEREELPEPEPRREGGPLARPLRALRLWLFVGVAFLYGVTESIYGMWAIPFLTEDRRLVATAASLALAAFWAALTAGRFVVAGLVLRLPPARVLPLLAGLMAGAALFVAATSGPRSAVALFALGGLGCSAVFPLALSLACNRFPAHRAWVSGVLYAALCLGIGAGSFAAGLLRPVVELANVYRLAALPAAVAAGLALRATATHASLRAVPGSAVP